jgi:hypothetical protein
MSLPTIREIIDMMIRGSYMSVDVSEQDLEVWNDVVLQVDWEQLCCWVNALPTNQLKSTLLTQWSDELEKRINESGVGTLQQYLDLVESRYMSRALYDTKTRVETKSEVRIKRAYLRRLHWEEGMTYEDDVDEVYGREYFKRPVDGCFEEFRSTIRVRSAPMRFIYGQPMYKSSHHERGDELPEWVDGDAEHVTKRVRRAMRSLL